MQQVRVQNDEIIIKSIKAASIIVANIRKRGIVETITKNSWSREGEIPRQIKSVHKAKPIESGKI